MRILWHSTAPWAPSSYSVLTKSTVPYIAKDYPEMIVSTWYGLEGASLPWPIEVEDGKVLQIPIWPKIENAGYGTEAMDKLFQFAKADILITVCDVWVFNKHITAKTRFCPWLPIDHDPIPNKVLDALKSAIYPMCYSKWGTELLNDAGIKAHYIPVGVDAKNFNYIDVDKKAIRKQYFDLPEDADFVVSMIAANKDPQDRKGFNEALLAFAEFHKTHPKSYLYIHTNWDGAFNIKEAARILGIEKKVLRPDPIAFILGMLKEDYIANIYRASDVLLNTAKSEGFGIPLVEAQMCGCPVAATDYSTTDELLMTGWKIDTIPDFTVGADSYRVRAKVDSTISALEDAYAEKDNIKLRKKAARLAKNYRMDYIYPKYWKPALKEIESLLDKEKKVMQI